MKTKFYFTTIASPIGDLELRGTGEALTALIMTKQRHLPQEIPGTVRDAGPFREARQQLDEYFANERHVFELPIAPVGTEFQRAVWEGLCGIPFGETISYGELARRVGNPKAVRAVGLANGRNPIAIVIPCHRVIGANGSLTGFGGGLDRKRYLLELESGGTLL